MKSFTDQLNRTIEIDFPPKRIVSLVPSQTELLYDLGLENEIVGITRFCIHPKSLFDSKIKVGGTKNYKLDKIRALKPDLIIANKEENDKESLELLAKEFPVWISDIKNLEEALQMISDIGALCNKEKKAQKITQKITQKISENFQQLKTLKQTKKVAYLIWQGPLMSINKDTFIHEMLACAGFINIFGAEDSRYPEISLAQIKEKQADYLFLSSEPYPFKTSHIEAFEKELPNAKVVLVDGEMFSWYGSRLIQTAEYLKGLQ